MIDYVGLEVKLTDLEDSDIDQVRRNVEKVLAAAFGASFLSVDITEHTPGACSLCASGQQH